MPGIVLTEHDIHARHDPLCHALSFQGLPEPVPIGHPCLAAQVIGELPSIILGEGRRDLGLGTASGGGRLRQGCLRRAVSSWRHLLSLYEPENACSDALRQRGPSSDDRCQARISVHAWCTQRVRFKLGGARDVCGVTALLRPRLRCNIG